MRTFIIHLLWVLGVCFNNQQPILAANNIFDGDDKRGVNSDEIHGYRVYKVNRRILDYPDNMDLSTPEAAYATINRVLIKGDGTAFKSLRVERKRNRPRAKSLEPYTYKQAKKTMDMKIIEVHIFQERFAYVIARKFHGRPKPDSFDVRCLELEGNNWLNSGHDSYFNIQKPRAKFRRYCAEQTQQPERLKIDAPEAYLEPFVEFLKKNAEEPTAFVIKALAKHKLVIIGEIHHRPRYWAFNSSLVTEPEFPKLVSTIYMELPSHAQELVYNFLEAKEYNPMPVIEMLRDMMWNGWPDQAMLDFFQIVRDVNRKLPSEQKIRIILVDMQRPWEKIKKKEDWRQYRVDRDKFMADNIIQDMKENLQDKRNALFIVGVGHAPLNFEFYGGEPVKKAGWHLCEELGRDKVYAFFPHSCRITNTGKVEGRLCLGLFDSAFAEVGNQPMAFPLEIGPFGKEQFDALADQLFQSNYRDGYDGYLYLGQLEEDTCSSLIQDFYTDDFVKELDRRYRLMFDKGLVEGCQLAKLDAESFIDWMSNSYGNPKEWRRNLGPIDAWKSGDKWKQEIQVVKQKSIFDHPEIITKAAERLFNAIRNADFEHHYGGRDWHNFPADDCDYLVRTNAPGWVQWVCRTFKNNPVEHVELGKVFEGPENLPTIPYKLMLHDGRILKGELPFRYDPQQQCWVGIRGLDWHLKEQ